MSFKEFKIQNMVGSCDVKFPIRLEGLYFNHQMFADYEPEVNAESCFCVPALIRFFELG